MRVETVVWGVVPAVVAIESLVVSGWALHRQRTSTQAVLFAGVALLIVAALCLLGQMFLVGGYPTFLPHVAIVVADAIAVAQLIASLQRPRVAVV